MHSSLHFLPTTYRGHVLRLSVVVGLALFAVAAAQARMVCLTPLPGEPILIGASSQGYLGVTVHDVDPSRAAKEKLPNALGAEVVSLDHDAPAAKAGVHNGDIIQAINGQPVTDSVTLSHLLHDMPVGKHVDLQIVHNARIEHVQLQLADRHALVQHAWAHHFHVNIPEPAPLVNSFAGQRTFAEDAPVVEGDEATNPQAYIGAQVEPLTPQLARFFGVQAGTGLLVRDVQGKSPAALAGLDAGDILLSANGMPLETADDWVQTLRTNSGRPVAILVLRNRKTLTLAITVDARITQSELRVPAELGRMMQWLLHRGQ